VQLDRTQGLIQVRLESGSKVVGDVVERRGSPEMAKGKERQCSSMILNIGLIQVRQDATVLESINKVYGKVVERCGSTRIAKETLL